MTLLGAEIEAADILALEALRLFDRLSWQRLSGLVPQLTSTSDKPTIFAELPTPEPERLTRVIDDAKRPELLREVLVDLFPAAARHLGGSNYGGDSLSHWRLQRRVAHPAVLQLYLSKQLQPTHVSAIVLERSVASVGDADEFARVVADALDE